MTMCSKTKNSPVSSFPFPVQEWLQRYWSVGSPCTSVDESLCPTSASLAAFAVQALDSAWVSADSRGWCASSAQFPVTFTASSYKWVQHRNSYCNWIGSLLHLTTPWCEGRLTLKTAPSDKSKILIWLWSTKQIRSMYSTKFCLNSSLKL